MSEELKRAKEIIEQVRARAVEQARLRLESERARQAKEALLLAQAREAARRHRQITGKE